ncbi:MAG: capsule biosynthesis protein [Pseudomonadota bacterium]
MSSNPSRFKILRGGGEQAPNAALSDMQAQRETPFEHVEDAADTGGAAPVPAQAEKSPREEIEEIKKENLTGRQLRIARRLAQRHDLNPTSDLDAVRLLRRKGVDPFAQQDMHVLNPTNPAPGEPELDSPGNPAPVALPATVRQKQGAALGEIKPQKAKPQVIDDDTRDQEVRRIQKELVRRRRRRLGVLMVKLAAFVALPSIIAGHYFYNVATPMYATHSEFVIETADNPTVAGGAGGLLSGSPFETQTESIAVQGYLTSRDAMLRLDASMGFRELFQNPGVDPLQRLEPEATNEDAYKIYKKRVIIGFDPTEGVIRMEVIAPTPNASRQISEELIAFAEEQVDQMTARLRIDQMTGARDIYEEAEQKFNAAQDDLADAQRAKGSFDAEGDYALIQGQISTLETQILESELELAELLDNPRPNETKVRVTERRIERLNVALDEKRAAVTEGAGNATSIVDVSAELRKAENALLMRQQLLATALQGLETARQDANRQTRYLTMAVSPVTPDKATYPRAFENTLLSIVVFAGIYLMISLTASILREQVTT